MDFRKQDSTQDSGKEQSQDKSCVAAGTRIKMVQRPRGEENTELTGQTPDVSDLILQSAEILHNMDGRNDGYKGQVLWKNKNCLRKIM